MNSDSNTNNHDSDRYALGLAASGMHMAQYLYNEESDPQRKEKMGRIISKKRELFVSTLESYIKKYGELKSGGTHTADVTNWVWKWKLDQRLTLMIDVLYSDPFLPYEVKKNEKQFTAAWEKLGTAIGVGSTAREQIEANAKDARKSHSHIPWLKIGLTTGVAAVLLVATAGTIAPVLGGALGTSAGLSGAAAVSYGLALLGGGSLAAGGAGMAGGMWLVTTTLAVSGTAMVAIPQIAYQLGAQQFQEEVIKLQVNLKTQMSQNQLSLVALQTKISALRQQRVDLESHLKGEKDFNDPNSKRLKDLEAKIQALTDAIDWLEKEAR